MVYSLTSNERQIEFNPEDLRHITDFAKGMPTILDYGIARISWILLAPTFIDGVDLSRWNWSEGRFPDFKVIYDNDFTFVILKATESDWFDDERFEQGYQEALDNGLIVMPYHFNRTNVGGAKQCYWHLEKIANYLKAIDGKTILWNDIETVDDDDGVGAHQNRARAYNQIAVAEGFQTGNYSSHYLWNKVMGTTPVSWVNDYWQWAAHWTPAASPLLPIGWTKEKSKFWQYGISPTYGWAKEVGTDGKVDVNRFYGTVQELEELLGVTSPPSQDCCEEMKNAIADVHSALVLLSDKSSMTDSRVANIENEQLTMAQQIQGMKTEINTLSSGVHNLEGNQQEMMGQIEHLLDLVSQVGNIFTK